MANASFAMTTNLSPSNFLENFMKHLTKLSLIAASLFVAGTAAAFDVPELIRGPLPADLKAHLSSPIKVATCPAGYNEKFANQKLSCERTVRQTANIQCSSQFPNYVARNVGSGSDRDLCVKNGIVVTSNGSLAGLNDGVDFIRVPVDGTRNGVSFVAGHPNAAQVDAERWSLDVTNTGASGISDRYRRSFIVKASPILVNP
jgi:hypothetical protein